MSDLRAAVAALSFEELSEILHRAEFGDPIPDDAVERRVLIEVHGKYTPLFLVALLLEVWRRAAMELGRPEGITWQSNKH